MLKYRLIKRYLGITFFILGLCMPLTLITQNKISKPLVLKKTKWAKTLAKHPYNRSPRQVAKIRKMPKADRPDLAFEQDYLMTMDPSTGKVPYERKILANQLVDEMLHKPKYKAAIAGVTWQERGPNNVGGRTRAIAFDPNDATNKKVWAGGVGGGLWYTNDITATSPTWVHVDGFWDNIAISCIAFNPNNTQEIYVGTGEGFFNGGAQRGGDTCTVAEPTCPAQKGHCLRAQSALI